MGAGLEQISENLSPLIECVQLWEGAHTPLCILCREVWVEGSHVTNVNVYEFI